MGQAVLHFEKLKTGSDMANMAAHNTREKIYDETGNIRSRPSGLAADEPWPPDYIIDASMSQHNEGQVGKRSDSIGRAWAKTVAEAGLERKPQKNAARAIEAVLTASKGSFETVDEWQKYLRVCREWAEHKFGSENVLQWNTHYDETTPHLHMILMPIVRDPNSGNKYSSANFLGGPDGLRILQESFSSHLFTMGYAFDRFDRTKKKHTNQKEWKSELVKKEMEIQKERASLDEFINELRNEYDEREKKVKDTEERQKARGSELTAWSKDLDAVEKNLTPDQKLIATIGAAALKEGHANIPEKEKFWEQFPKAVSGSLPDLAKQTLQDVRQQIESDRLADVQKNVDNNIHKIKISRGVHL